MEVAPCPIPAPEPLLCLATGSHGRELNVFHFGDSPIATGPNPHPQPANRLPHLQGLLLLGCPKLTAKIIDFLLIFLKEHISFELNGSTSSTPIQLCLC